MRLLAIINLRIKMARFNSEKQQIELEIKPVEIRDHLCGRYICYKAALRFSTGTAIALPDIFDDGKLHQTLSTALDDKSKAPELLYNNRAFSYLNEPLYSILLNCNIEKQGISQPSLFAEETLFSQPSLFGFNEAEQKNAISLKISINKVFKENCCWEDLVDYIMEQQSLAKIVNSRTRTRLSIEIENGKLDELLTGKEVLGKEMLVSTSLTFDQSIEDYRTSIFQLSKELEGLTPQVSTFVDSDTAGQRCFDLGPEAKPFVDTRRIKRLEDLSLKLGAIFAMPKKLQKAALFNISAQIEYLLSEELRKSLRSIFAKFPDKDSELKALQNASEEITKSIPEINSDEELIDAIISCKYVQEGIASIVLKTKSAKEIISAITRISEETSLKKLVKLIVRDNFSH